jgi:hypothetical protein
VPPETVWFYFRKGRRQSIPLIKALGEPDLDESRRWTVLSKAVSHCGRRLHAR